MSTLRFLGVVIGILALGISACAGDGPRPIGYGKEQCAHCRMTISDARFGSQLVTAKGRVYNFDDVQCLLAFVKEGGVAREEVAQCYLPDYTDGNQLMPAEGVRLLKSESLKSPMRGDIAAFADDQALEEVREMLGGEQVNWDDLWN